MGRQVDRPVFDHGGCRVFSEKVIVLPVLYGTHRANGKPAATIRADILQYRGRAVSAEGAFEAADHGLSRFRRQGDITVFAAGSEFKHGSVLLQKEGIKLINEVINGF
jgi:hypothetical protein